MKRLLAGAALLVSVSFLATAARADSVAIIASSTFPIGLDTNTNQFLSESFSSSFDWNGTLATDPVLVATGPVQGFSWRGTFFDTNTNTLRGDWINGLGDDFLVDFSFLQNGTPIVGDAFICPSCQSLINPGGPGGPGTSTPEGSTSGLLCVGLAGLLFLRRIMPRPVQGAREALR